MRHGGARYEEGSSRVGRALSTDPHGTVQHPGPTLARRLRNLAHGGGTVACCDWNAQHIPVCRRTRKELVFLHAPYKIAVLPLRRGGGERLLLRMGGTPRQTDRPVLRGNEQGMRGLLRLVGARSNRPEALE